MQCAARHFLADAPAVLRHFGALAEHLGGDFELFEHDRRRTFLAREIETRFPTGDRHFARHVLRERDGLLRAVLHAQHRDRGAQAQKAHAVTTLAQDLIALLTERQAVDLDHVVEHAREHLHDFAELFPIEARIFGERIDDEAREIDRAEQARAVRRQRLLAAGVGRANGFAPPVVVHLVHAIDEHEARLSEVVGRGHDHVPHAAGRNRLIDTAADQARFVRDVGGRGGPFAPHELAGIGDIEAFGFAFLPGDREGEPPFLVGLHGIHEFVGDEQRQIELTQPARFALGANELEHIGMTDIERAHLCAAATARRGHGETHLVVDIHERQRTGRVCAGTRHVRATRTHRGEFIADTAAGLQREARFMDLREDVVHRIGDRAGDSAVDRRGGRLVLLRAGIRGDATGRNAAFAQRPQKLLVPFGAHVLALHIGECTSDALISLVHGAIDRRAVFGGQPILLFPNIEGGLLKWDAVDVHRLKLDCGLHAGMTLPVGGRETRTDPSARASLVVSLAGGDAANSPSSARCRAPVRRWGPISL